MGCRSTSTFILPEELALKMKNNNKYTIKIKQMLDFRKNMASIRVYISFTFNPDV